MARPVLLCALLVPLLAISCGHGQESTTAATTTLGPRPVSSPTTPVTATTAPGVTMTTASEEATTTVTAATSTTVSLPSARCFTYQNGYILSPQSGGVFGDQATTVEVSGSARLTLHDGLRLKADFEVVLHEHTDDGSEIEHRVAVVGEATAEVAVEGSEVSIVSADTSGLLREVHTTVDGVAAPVPEQVQGVGDFFDPGFEGNCGLGSGLMFATTTDGSGLELSWAVVR